MPKLFNQARVDEVATFIAAELKPLLDYKHYSNLMSRRITEACPTYHRGLTNIERVAATLKALNLAALDLFSDLTSLTREPTASEEWDEEDSTTAELAINPAIPPTDAAQPSLKLV